MTLAVLSKLWPAIAGIAGLISILISILIGKRVYDSKIRKETEARITSDLSADSTTKIKEFLAEEAKTETELGPLVDRVPRVWSGRSMPKKSTSSRVSKVSKNGKVSKLRRAK